MKIKPHNLVDMLDIIDKGTLSGPSAKAVFEDMFISGKTAADIIKEKGLVQISDAAALEKTVSKVLGRCSAEVAAYKAGKKKLLGFFVGQVMQETRGRANPKQVNAILKKKLDN